MKITEGNDEVHTTLDDTVDDEATGTNTNVPAVTSNALTPPPGMRLVDPLDLYLEREAGGPDFDGDFLNFNGQTGGWTRGRDREAIGATVPFLVNLPGMAVGHVKLVDGKIVDHAIGLVREGFQRKPREELDDYDESCWPTNKRGEPIDPWKKTTYLPMRCLEDGEPVVYGPLAPTHLAAIKQFVKTCRRTDLDGKCPMVLLGSTNFKNQHGGVTYKPDFKIIGEDYWEPGIPAPPMTPVAVPITPPPSPATAKLAAPVKAKPPGRNNMDDEIPF